MNRIPRNRFKASYCCTQLSPQYRFTPMSRLSVWDFSYNPPVWASTEAGSTPHAIADRPSSSSSSTNPRLGVGSQHQKLHRCALRQILGPPSDMALLTRILHHLTMHNSIFRNFMQSKRPENGDDDANSAPATTPAVYGRAVRAVAFRCPDIRRFFSLEVAYDAVDAGRLSPGCAPHARRRVIHHDHGKQAPQKLRKTRCQNRN